MYSYISSADIEHYAVRLVKLISNIMHS